VPPPQGDPPDLRPSAAPHPPARAGAPPRGSRAPARAGAIPGPPRPRSPRRRSRATPRAHPAPPARRVLRASAAALAVAVAVAAALAAPGCGRAVAPTPDAAQHRLEQRLLAPCCWRESLADHTSPTADALRAEVAARLGAGEAAAAIEADLVARHGDRIRALPAGRDPRWLIGAVGATLMLASLGGLAAWYRRRRAHPAAATPAAPPAPERDADRERLDDELLAVD
jgi:cytochrome c-type biogenesis protein CcmH